MILKTGDEKSIKHQKMSRDIFPFHLQFHFLHVHDELADEKHFKRKNPKHQPQKSQNGSLIKTQKCITVLTSHARIHHFSGATVERHFTV